MDKANLSKHKYIYMVYLSDANKIHVERYPIAYINRRYVYFIRGHQQMLDYAMTENVHDSLEKYMEANVRSGRSPVINIHNRCFWTVSEKNPNETKEALLLEYDKVYREREVSKAKAAMERAQQEAEHAKRRYESLLKG